MPLMGYRDSKQVAFANFLYIRENATAYVGGKAIRKPTGFYIVAWKNGNITRVPIEQTRLARVPGAAAYRVVFPGMKEYDSGNPRHYAIEFNGKAVKAMPPKVRQFFKSVTTRKKGCCTD